MRIVVRIVVRIGCVLTSLGEVAGTATCLGRGVRIHAYQPVDLRPGKLLARQSPGSFIVFNAQLITINLVSEQPESNRCNLSDMMLSVVGQLLDASCWMM